ncbi:hypothetical protein V8E52_011729 [Russula decolorans]
MRFSTAFRLTTVLLAHLVVSAAPLKRTTDPGTMQVLGEMQLIRRARGIIDGLQKAKSCCWAYASWEACQREYRSSAGTGYRTTVTAGTSTSSTRQSRARHETRKYDSEYSFRHCHFLLSPDFRKRDYSLHENKNDTEKK